MKPAKVIIAILLICSCLSIQAQTDVRQTLLRELGAYPDSQLADVYKNFFQDRFGPGHLLNDTTRAGAYLRSELAETTDFSGPLFELTGADGNFVRVNLSVIRDRLVTYPDFFEAFVKSVQSIEAPEPDEWREYWSTVDAQLAALGVTFPNEETDREMIANRLASGDFAVHHSDRYNAAYHFHYRIISLPIFTRDILPKILKKQ